MKNNQFQISYKSSNNDDLQLQVVHRDETFEVEFKNELVSIINNGDNSWSQVSGNALAQETVNLFGDAIEKYYQQQSI